MSVWSVYTSQGTEIRRFKSKAAAISFAQKHRLTARKTFTRGGVLIDYAAILRPRLDAGRVTVLRSIRALETSKEVSTALYRIYVEVTEAADQRVAQIGKKLDTALKRVTELEIELAKIRNP